MAPSWPFLKRRTTESSGSPPSTGQTPANSLTLTPPSQTGRSVSPAPRGQREALAWLKSSKNLDAVIAARDAAAQEVATPSSKKLKKKKNNARQPKEVGENVEARTSTLRLSRPVTVLSVPPTPTQASFDADNQNGGFTGFSGVNTESSEQTGYFDLSLQRRLQNEDSGRFSFSFDSLTEMKLTKEPRQRLTIRNDVSAIEDGDRKNCPLQRRVHVRKPHAVSPESAKSSTVTEGSDSIMTDSNGRTSIGTLSNNVPPDVPPAVPAAARVPLIDDSDDNTEDESEKAKRILKQAEHRRPLYDSGDSGDDAKKILKRPSTRFVIEDSSDDEKSSNGSYSARAEEEESSSSSG